MIERFHRTMKSAIMARKDNWLISLPIVLMGLRMIPGDSGFSPFTALTGSVMLCPHPIICKDYVHNAPSETVKTLIKEMQAIDFSSNSAGIIRSAPKPFIPSDLLKCPKVWLRVDRIRKSLEAPYSGPYDVISRSEKFFTLKLPQGVTTVSIDRLKPAYLKVVLDNDSVDNSTTDNQISNDVILPSSDVSPSDLGHSTEGEVREDIEPEDISPNIIPDVPRTTRSGRTVRFRRHSDHVYF